MICPLLASGRPSPRCRRAVGGGFRRSSPDRLESRAVPTPRKKVLLAMSGGVDSSVAAALLLRQGYDVMGAFLRLGSPKGVEGPVQGGEHCETNPPGNPDNLSPPAGGKNKQGCCSVLDAADARRVAGLLGIPFYVLNF